MSKRTKRAKPKRAGARRRKTERRRNSMRRNSMRQHKIIIPNSSTTEEQLVKSRIDGDLDISNVHSANDLAESVRSYSPGVNKLLVSKRQEMTAHDIFGCGLEEILIDGDHLFERRHSMVKVAEGPVCKPWNSKEAIQVMLDNLRAAGPVDVQSVVTPRQIDSNCWFNTFFVTFFISDKGRKFFRFFRELMIRGEDVRKKKLTPGMAHAFFFLNACIEAAYNNKNVALAMNTNHIILKIFDSIRKKDIDEMNEKGLGDVDEAGNPLDYYIAMMEYIDNKTIRHVRLRAPEEVDSLFRSQSTLTPHLFVVEIIETPMSKIPTQFKAGRHTYVLDASVVMDTQRKHFCSTLVCAGKEMGFDGASFSRLEPFKWKALLNQDKDWTFEGSIFDEDATDKIWWNFQKSYKLLFYYRT